MNVNETEITKDLSKAITVISNCDESFMVLRKNKFYFHRLNKILLHNKPVCLHKNSKYLITGGCGALGLVTLESLLSMGAKEVILLSRNITKPSMLFDLKRIQSNYKHRKIKLIAADVANFEQMRSIFDELNADNNIKGIIHAAGVAIKKNLLDHNSNDVDIC